MSTGSDREASTYSFGNNKYPIYSLVWLDNLVHIVTCKAHSLEENAKLATASRVSSPGPFLSSHGSSPIFSMSGIGQMPRLLPHGQCPFSPSKGEEGATSTPIFQMSNHSESPSLGLWRQGTIRKQSRQCPDTCRFSNATAAWVEVSPRAPRAVQRRGSSLPWPSPSAPGCLLRFS